MNFLFSVIIPVHVDHKYWKRAIESVAKQTFRNFELIVSINSSDFPITKLQKELSLYPNLKSKIIESNEIAGVSHALNKGIDASEGEFIVWLSSDDYFDELRLANHNEVIEKFLDVDVVYSGWKIIDENGNLIESIEPNKIIDNSNIYKVFLRGLLMGGAMSIRKLKLYHNNLFDPELLYTQDYAMWFRLTLNSKFQFTEEINTYYQYHQNQTTRVANVQLEVAQLWDKQISRIISHHLKDLEMTSLNYIIWQTNILIGANYKNLTLILRKHFEVEIKKYDFYNIDCNELQKFIENVKNYSGHEELVKERNDLGLLAAGFRQQAQNLEKELLLLKRSFIFRLLMKFQRFIKVLKFF